jgi:hypothetical protein
VLGNPEASDRRAPVFDDLDQQPWRDLTHAYGSANDVPRWLRQLTSSNEKIRVTALNDLYGSICHQNWNCPATAYTVPYVIELLQQPLVEQKAGLLAMLADIASCEPLNEADWRKNKHVPSYNVPLRIPLKDAHTAVAEDIPTCITHLYHPPVSPSWAPQIWRCGYRRRMSFRPIQNVLMTSRPRWNLRSGVRRLSAVALILPSRLDSFHLRLRHAGVSSSAPLSSQKAISCALSRRL